MGQDIHAYVETMYSYTEAFRSFSGQIYLPRNYFIFSLMSPNGRLATSGEVIPIVKQKENITKMGWEAFGDYYDPISKVSSVDADRFIKDYGSKYYSTEKDKLSDSRILDCGTECNYITNPDAHGLNWVTEDEFRKVLDIYSVYYSNYHLQAEYKATLSIMEILSKDYGFVRLLYWFDS